MISVLRNFTGYQGISEVFNDWALLDHQAGPAEGGRQARAKRGHPGEGGYLLSVL